MIPKSYITQWSQYAPWATDNQIEQDQVISRAIVAIFSEPFLREKLAFRGGTALYKLHLTPAPRYSEDIDLVMMEQGEIGPVFDKLRETLNFLDCVRTQQKQWNNIMRFQFTAEDDLQTKLRMKVEINGKEDFSVEGWKDIDFSMTSDWFTGECQARTYSLAE